MLRWLTARSLERPLLLVIDDLHWADRDSLWLLRPIARLTRQRPLLLLLLLRSPDPDGRPSAALRDLLGELAREVEPLQLSLTGLEADQIGDLLSATASRPVAKALVDRLQQTTAGNPFYLRELFRHLIEEGMLAEPSPTDQRRYLQRGGCLGGATGDDRLA
jgi:predicted ATPase